MALHRAQSAAAAARGGSGAQRRRGISAQAQPSACCPRRRAPPRCIAAFFGGAPRGEGGTGQALASAAADVEAGVVPRPTITQTDEELAMRNIEFVSSTQGLDYEALSKLFFSVGFAKRDTRRLQRACEGAEGTAEGEELCGDEEVVAAPVRVVWARAIRKTRGTEPGALLGFARATTDGALCACIWDVAVAPAWQRLGIGRALVERLATGLADDGITSLALFSEPGAVRMYERLGFVQAQAQGGGGVRGMNLQQKTKARIKGELAKEDAEADAQRRAQEVAEESRAAL